MTVGEPPNGSQYLLPLSDRPDDVAHVHVVASANRDLIPATAAGSPLEAVEGALLVEVHLGDRPIIPGAWADSSVTSLAPGPADVPIDPSRLRMPAVVLGEADDAVLAWGETVWSLPLDGSVHIPDSCRPGVHRAAELRRLALCALGRRDEVALTRWRERDFEVPWHDVRMVPHAAWWFDVAQVPAGMRYADAARSHGVPVEKFSLSRPQGFAAEGTTERRSRSSL